MSILRVKKKNNEFKRCLTQQKKKCITKKCGQRTKCLVWNCKTMYAIVHLFFFYSFLFSSPLCLWGFSCIEKIQYWAKWFLISHPSFIINFQLSVSRAIHSSKDFMSQFWKHTHTLARLSHLFHHQFSAKRDQDERRRCNDAFVFYFVCVHVISEACKQMEFWPPTMQAHSSKMNGDKIQ